MKKILVVEDEEAISRALVDWLTLSPEMYEVELAEDGEEALKKLEIKRFDLILLDLVLPKRDGFSVLAEMKARNIDTKVIVLTNLQEEEDKKKVEQLGVPHFDFFVKNETKLSMLSEEIKKLFANL